MKRILVLALALFLAVSSLAVPSYAAESEDSIIDVLQAAEYQSYSDYGLNGSFSSPTGVVSSASNVRWSWANTILIENTSLNFIIESETQPDAMFFINDRGVFSYCNLVASSGNYYQYRVDSVDLSSSIILEGRFNSPYSGVFSVLSFFATAADTFSFSSVNYFSNAIMFDNGGGNALYPDEDDFLFPVSVSSGNNSELPVVIDFSGPTGSEFHTIDYGEVFVKVPFDGTLTQFDSISFLVFTCGEIKNYGGRLEFTDGNVIDGLETSIEYCGKTQMIFETLENFHRIHCYIVTVDTSGYDLTNRVVTLSMDIESVLGSFVYEYDRGYYCQISSVTGKINFNTAPWYAALTNWFGTLLNTMHNESLSWIRGIFDTVSGGFTTLTTWLRSIYDNVSGGFTSVTTWLTHTYNSVTAGFSSMVSGFQSLLDVMNSSGDNQQFDDDVSQQGDKLNQMDDALSSVTKPALDRVDTNISGIVSDTDLANTAHVYTYIIDDNIMAPALTMVTILAMMSFALFGKR